MGKRHLAFDSEALQGINVLMSMANDSIAAQENLEHVLDIYPFSDPKQQMLFDKMIHTLRCSVCQNQSLADSMAPLAIDLRGLIYKQVLADFKEEAIVEFVSHRYGNFVRYDPPMMWSTSLLWFGPLMILCMVGLFLKKFFFSRPAPADCDVGFSKPGQHKSGHPRC